jgi:hypothetical protein
MTSTRISQHINAPRAGVYRALLDADALSDADGGTDLLAVHDGLPGGVSPADNETGWRMALAKLATLVEPG